MAFTKITDTLNVHQSRATRPVEDAATLKALYDQDVNTVKTRFNNFIDELEATTAGASIGVNAVGVVASNVTDAIAEVQSNVAGAVLGVIPNNSITELKMAAEMKKQAGGVAEYDTVDTLSGTVSGHTTSIATNVTNLDILRLAKDTTGSANAYILDTEGTFDFTKDGNMLPFNPNFTNTGSSTIAVDGTTKNIRKFDIDTDAYVILEADDIKKNTPIMLRYDVSEGFFVLAPKGGAVIKSFQEIVTTIGSGVTSLNVAISSVDLSKAICEVTFASSQNEIARAATAVKFNSSTEVNVSRTNSTGIVYVVIKIYEFNNVKTLQRGSVTYAETVNPKDITISSVDKTKSLIFTSFKSTYDASIAYAAWLYRARLTTSTNLSINKYTIASGNTTIEWQVLEFE